MATLVTFHAHPDDECIVTGGVMRKAFEEGHRVVLVVATRGEAGEVPDFLEPGEELWQRRVDETYAAADLLGVARVEFLGYLDSGMMGDERNDRPGSFWTADVEEAARKLAAILEEEDAKALTIYDSFGGYGHPDHIQVHRVGQRAAEIAGTPAVYQAMVKESEFREAMRRAGEAEPPPLGEDAVPESELNVGVDVSKYLDVKRAAMRAHASQIPEQSFFLALDDETFAHVFGTEWFIREGHGPETALDL
ncbi:PIG-L family deacetylase [Lentzea flava]|uniref:GlcNAc-PI de-N-acetylase n=1 Tax=Lentzea flava TaxID=103732 RepID=A0ABQ2V6A0_9PSEU|nr:PIG-L family deacetylase [Lentzea flava]MCP2198190.1 N-acetylglucosaminyl deacetylase, LmbE family [Lentzea flava]GGU70600.1 GlcNAc-PI de-N-acetylase [Lentzea flava]